MILRRLLFLTACLMLPGAAFASTKVAQEKLTTAIDAVVDKATNLSNPEALAQALRPVLEKYICFDVMTRRAVGPGWRKFSNSQQARATELFTTLLIRTYSKKITPGEQPIIDYKMATEPAPGRVEIPTTLVYKGSRYQVTYRLEQAEDWKVTDVLIEGVSFVANYRSQFNATFMSGGADGVVRALEQSVNNTK